MGLDQWAFYKINSELDNPRPDIGEDENDEKDSAVDLAYWRKHPNLQGWMEKLWISRGGEQYNDKGWSAFNNVELELTWEDLDKLEKDVLNFELPFTTGFFFGTPADEEYREQDLNFIRRARDAISNGFKVFYSSNW